MECFCLHQPHSNTFIAFDIYVCIWHSSIVWSWGQKARGTAICFAASSLHKACSACFGCTAHVPWHVVLMTHAYIIQQHPRNLMVDPYGCLLRLQFWFINFPDNPQQCLTNARSSICMQIWGALPLKRQIWISSVLSDILSHCISAVRVSVLCWSRLCTSLLRDLKMCWKTPVHTFSCPPKYYTYLKRWRCPQANTIERVAMHTDDCT